MNSNNIKSKNNPKQYTEHMLKMATRRPIDTSLLTSQLYIGNSAKNPKDSSRQVDAHHIFETLLFPTPPLCGLGTPKLKCVQKTHVALHKLLASASCFEDYQLYEKALRKECPKIPADLHIAEIYWHRVKALRPSIARRCLKTLFSLMFSR